MSDSDPDSSKFRPGSATLPSYQYMKRGNGTIRSLCRTGGRRMSGDLQPLPRQDRGEMQPLPRQGRGEMELEEKVTSHKISSN